MWNFLVNDQNSSRLIRRRNIDSLHIFAKKMPLRRFWSLGVSRSKDMAIIHYPVDLDLLHLDMAL